MNKPSSQNLRRVALIELAYGFAWWLSVDRWDSKYGVTDPATRKESMMYLNRLRMVIREVPDHLSYEIGRFIKRTLEIQHELVP